VVIAFSKLLQLVTTSKAYAFTHLHISEVAQSVTVSTSRCLVAASNDGRSPSSGFPKCPPPQLPASFTMFA
jgi:hypothetical protein